LDERIGLWSPVEDGIDDDKVILYADPHMAGLYDWTKKGQRENCGTDFCVKVLGVSRKLLGQATS
jgi:hypothetical protein